MKSRLDPKMVVLLVLALAGTARNAAAAAAQQAPLPQRESYESVSPRIAKDAIPTPIQVAGTRIPVDAAMRATWGDLVLIREAGRDRGADDDASRQFAPFMPPPVPREIGFAPPQSAGGASSEDFLEPPRTDIQALAAIGASFHALPDDGTRIPPDTNGAVGPSHVMTMLNTQVRVQDKTGVMAISDVSLATFWAGTGAAGPFDPKLVYDQGSGRWLATADAEARSAASAVLFAISDTQDPTGAWTFYSIDADATNIDWADFPDIGFNNTWIVITNNMFTVAADAFSGAAMWVIDKSTALTGGALTVTHFAAGFDTAGVPADGGPFTSFTLRPAKTFGAEPTQYLVSNPFLTLTGNGVLRISEITGTAAAPVWSAVPGSIFLDSGLFVVPANFGFSQIDASQLGTNLRIETNDARMLDATFRNGRIWCTHSGGLPAGGFAGQTGVFWYQLDPAQMAATGDPVVQSGVLDGGFDVHYFFPSIAVNQNDDMCLGFTRSDSTRFAEAVATGRVATDPPGATDPITVIKSGEDSYEKDFGGGSVRWGDYSATVVDPSDDTTFWTIQEYAALDVGPNPSDDKWSTWWASKIPQPTGDLLFTVEPGSQSVQQADPIIVTLDVANLSTAINGVNALIQYDSSLLQLESIVPLDLGFAPPADGWFEVNANDIGGDLAYAAGIFGASTISNGVVATLTFTALAPGVTNLSFLSDNPPAHPSLATVLTRADTGLLISPAVTPSATITIGPCDDGLTCTTDTFDLVNLVCVFTPNPGFCAIAGVCFTDGAFNPLSDCELCDAAINQSDWTALAAGSSCGPTPDLCEQQDTCDGAGTCIDNGPTPASTVCRADVGQCDLPELCDGVNLACPPDGFEAPGTSCGPVPDLCEQQDTCDAAGVCVDNGPIPVTTVCRADAGQCDLADVCDGVSLACPPDAFEAPGTSCGAVPDLCEQQDTCDNAGVCIDNGPIPASTVCRADAGQCDLPEVCDGVSLACPQDAFEAPGTSCGPTPDLCEEQDTCDAAGTCIDNGLTPGGTECRPDAGQCDLAEACDGVNPACPPDAFEGAGTTCDLDGNLCTVDLCDATGGCLFDADVSGIDVTLEIEALGPATTVTRDTTFVITNCAGIADTRTVPVTFDSLGIGQALLVGVDTGAEWISVTEGHTLRKLLPLVFAGANGCVATVSFTGPDKLISGDYSNAFLPQNNLIDLQDFAVLSIEWNQPVDPNLGTLADATGNGIQDVGDFTSLQAHFAEVGDAVNQCLGGGGASARDDPMGRSERANLGVRTEMSPDEIAAVGAKRADVNGDGVINLNDIRAFAALHNLPLTPAFRATLDRLQADASVVPKEAASIHGDARPDTRKNRSRQNFGRQGFSR